MGDKILMLYLWMSAVCFVLFIIYDINSVRHKNHFLHALFFVGCVGLLIITLSAVLGTYTTVSLFRLICGSILCLVFIFLLVYTLFFALPFENTYVITEKAEGQKPQTCRKGLYALSRHPGVLWLSGLYFSLFMAVGGEDLLYLSCGVTIYNIIYIIFQDVWTFPRTFLDYEEYQQAVPFLLPTASSIKECIYTLKKEDANEVC